MRHFFKSQKDRTSPVRTRHNMPHTTPDIEAPDIVLVEKTTSSNQGLRQKSDDHIQYVRKVFRQQGSNLNPSGTAPSSASIPSPAAQNQNASSCKPPKCSQFMLANVLPTFWLLALIFLFIIAPIIELVHLCEWERNHRNEDGAGLVVSCIVLNIFIFVPMCVPGFCPFGTSFMLQMDDDGDSWRERNDGFIGLIQFFLFCLTCTHGWSTIVTNELLLSNETEDINGIGMKQWSMIASIGSAIGFCLHRFCYYCFDYSDPVLTNNHHRENQTCGAAVRSCIFGFDYD